MLRKIKSCLLTFKASSLQGRGKYDKVIELCLIAIGLDPKNLSAYALLADDLERTEQYDKAVEILSKALSYYPDYPIFNMEMAEALARQGATLEQIVPYILKYFSKATLNHIIFPWYMRFIARILNIANKMNETEQYIREHHAGFEKWARQILSLHEGSGNNR